MFRPVSHDSALLHTNHDSVRPTRLGIRSLVGSPWLAIQNDLEPGIRMDCCMKVEKEEGEREKYRKNKNRGRKIDEEEGNEENNTFSLS